MKSPMIVAALLLAASLNAWGGMEEDVGQVRQEWERIKYKVAAKEQEEAYEKLAKESARVVTLYPTRAEPAIWHGIIEASYAGAKGGLGGLSLARSAKKSLEQALTIDPRALDGSAYTSLGSLYYQVPGWPIGFGDDKRALEFLQKGLAVNPDGIDPNYFYGDFLFRTGDYAGAEQALRKALQAPPREGRQLADEGRRKEINELLEKVRERRR
ncbi:MAG TPA: tetratricopeptide repeat protein [Burkholderiales bacterium]|nr:tetratricopeptide repeat protein [Burkholderiales bacterium]